LLSHREALGARRADIVRHFLLGQVSGVGAAKLDGTMIAARNV
jgi:hypothetical protein